MRCVVCDGEIQATPHHLNGKSNESEFPNLLPVNLELHNGLRRKGERPEDLKQELRTRALCDRANKHFRSGYVTRAYGCLRLAYAMPTHFYAENYRKFEEELALAAHCLYFLRRSASNAPLDMVWSILHWLLDREIEPALQEHKVRPPFGEAWLLAELASWLTEFGC